MPCRPLPQLLPRKIVRTARSDEILNSAWQIERSIGRRRTRGPLITAAVSGQIDVATWGKRNDRQAFDHIEAEMPLLN
jgi:hypothetical protein